MMFFKKKRISQIIFFKYYFKIIFCRYGNKKRYRDFTSFIRNKFGCRVQKVSINAGFTCPNKDGTKGIGGCTYCNNNTFNPDYCKPIKSILSQINEGIAFFLKNINRKNIYIFSSFH